MSLKNQLVLNKLLRPKVPIPFYFNHHPEQRTIAG
jgi:hypothetical protein